MEVRDRGRGRGGDNLEKIDMKRKVVKIIGSTPTGFLMKSHGRHRRYQAPLPSPRLLPAPHCLCQ